MNVQKFITFINSNYEKLANDDFLIVFLNTSYKDIEKYLYISNDNKMNFYNNLYSTFVNLIKKLNNEELLEIYAYAKEYYGPSIKSYITCFIDEFDFKLKNYKNDPDFTQLIPFLYLKTDEEKLKCIEYFLKQEEYDNFQFISTIIQSLNSDEMKLKYLYLVPDIYQPEIISTFSSDKIKIEIIDKTKIDYEKSIIASGLSTDELKMKYIKEMKNATGLETLISSLESDKLKIDCLKNLELDDSTKAFIINNFKNNNLKLEYLYLITTETNLYNIINNLNNDEDTIKVLDLLNSYQNKIELLINLENVDLAKDKIISMFKQYPRFFINKLIHFDNLNDEKISKILSKELLDYLTNEYNLNKDNLSYIAKSFGHNYIKYIENKNFQDIINSSKDSLIKIEQLIKCPKMNMEDILGIYNSLLQREFTIIKAFERSIFTRFLQTVENNDLFGFKSIIKELMNNKDANKIFKNKEFLNMINSEKDIEYNNLKELLNSIFANITNSNDLSKRKRLIDIFHYITNDYIMSLRNKYIQDGMQNISSKLYLNLSLNKEKVLKSIFKTNSENEILDLLKRMNKDFLPKEIIGFLENENILKDCIKFKKNPLNYKDNNITKEELEKNYLRQFTILLNECYKQGVFDIIKDDSLMDIIPNNDNFNYYDILVNLNVKQIEEKLLHDEELYNQVLSLNNKYKLSNWGYTFSRLLSNIEIEFNAGTVADFINNSKEVINCIKDSPSPIKLLDSINLYASSSYRNQILFGSDNYRYLVNNPSPYPASMSKQNRIKIAKKRFKDMYSKELITIPPLVETYSFKNEKITVTLGDTANPNNLTYGEKTGTCMRIGGVGNCLFDFCLLNENGFHISFTNPDDGSFISRVSGFRNGNTLFLNQLRDSCNLKYNNQDLITCLKKFSIKLIELSKNSELPIDNVVISSDCAMKPLKHKEINLNVKNIKKGYNNFFTNITSQAIVLATKNNKLSPIKLDVNPPRYETLRMIPKITFNNAESCKIVNQINIIESLLCTDEVDGAILINNAEISITGEDWYIYVDSDNYIHNKIINGISDKRNEKAQKEMDIYLIKINEMIGVNYVK